MNRQEIENHTGWKYISSLSDTERYTALFGKTQSDVEKYYNVTITEEHFTNLSNIPDEYARISVTDSFKNMSFIAVLKPTN